MPGLARKRASIRSPSLPALLAIIAVLFGTGAEVAWRAPAKAPLSIGCRSSINGGPLPPAPHRIQISQQARDSGSVVNEPDLRFAVSDYCVRIQNKPESHARYPR